MLDPIEASALRWALRLDGTSQAMAERMGAEIQSALDTIAADLSRRSGDNTPWTVARLQAVRQELVALQQALSERFGVLIEEGRQAVIETANPATAEAFAALTAHGLPVSYVAAPVEVLALATAAPYQGKTWQQWGAKLAQDTVNGVERELREALLLGESVPKAARRLQAVTTLQRRQAEALARTAFTDWATRAQLATYSANRRLIPSVRFLTALDGRVSAQCQAYSGREWAIDDPAIVRPPLHPRCRSVLTPVTASMESIIGERGRAYDERMARSGEQPSVMDRRPVKDISKDVRPQTIRRVPAGLTYEEWLRDYTTPEFQREVLGPTRHAAWLRGVPLSGMATYSRPLSIAELRRMYPQEFAQ